jgi:hypothetical protein
MPRIVHAIVIVLLVALGPCALFAQKSAKVAKPSVQGTLVDKTLSTYQVQVDNEPTPRLFYLVLPGNIIDPLAAEFARKVPVGSLIEISWVREKNVDRITDLFVMQTPGSFGLLKGMVAAKAQDSIDITDEKGKTEKYLSSRTAQGYIPEMLAAIEARNVGDRVEIRWVQDEGLRIGTMRLLELAPEAQPPGGQGGTVVGHVLERGLDWVTIKPEDGGQPERYVPQRIVGEKDALDREVLAVITKASRGMRLEARWFLDDGRRLYSLKRMPVGSKKAAKL